MSLGKQQHVVNLGVEALDASTPYVLVDLSDSDNFPHGEAFVGEIHLLGLYLNGDQASDGAFDLWVGVVTENDGTDGSVQWIWTHHAESVSNPTDSAGHICCSIDFTLGGQNPEGINCLVTAGALTHFVGNQSQANSVNWQNDTARVSPVGTSKPGVGDLVLWVEETTNGGTIDFSMHAIYETG